MTAIDRDRARAAFKSYTDAYDATNPRIALKIEHTYHVAEACDAVAREQGWSSEDIDLAWLCGLLHDMGRFEQLRRWASRSSLARIPPMHPPRQTSVTLSKPVRMTSSSERASPITATFACRHNSTSVHGASAISCAMATRSTLCAPSPTAPSIPSSRWMRTRF